MIEHPLEFEFRDRILDAGHVIGDRAQRVVVGFALREFEELGAVLEPSVDLAQVEDDALEQLLLAAELLRPLGLVPDARVLQRRVDLVQPQCLAVVVKDTPVERACARSGRQAWCRSH